MPVQRIPAATAEQLARPVWLRAVVTALPALVTIFWQGETLLLLKIALAAYFVLAGTAIWDYAKDTVVVPDAVRGPLASGAALWVLVGVGVLFVPSATAGAVVAAAGFLGMGLAELIAGLRGRPDFVPARDLLVQGGVGTATGVGLLAGMQLDVHGILGIAGMGLVILAVLLMISGASMTHEARRAAG